MPRTADHDARRAHIVDAVSEITFTEGITGVTVAATARRVGVSVGAVQHYFPTKEAMLVFAFETMRHRAWQRALSVVDAGESASRSIGEIVRDAALELLPLDADRQREYALKAAFAAQLHVHDDIRSTYARESQTLRSALEMALRNGMTCGEIPQGFDVVGGAISLAAIIDGLAVSVWLDATAEHRDQVIAALEQSLRRIFTGYCRTYDRPAFPS